MKGHWLSDTDVEVQTTLSHDAFDMTVTAKNVGTRVLPIGIGWHPYFQIPSGHRAQARLHIPATMMAVVNNYSDVFPTGQLKPVKGTVFDYTAPDGVLLDDHFLDDNFSHLQRTQGAVDVKVIDPESNYGLTVSALSPEIRTVQAYAPKNTTFVAIEDQFNYVDPFGKQWKGMDTGMVTLRPGQSVSDQAIAGYNVRSWSDADFTYVAVSDLPAADLATFERVFSAGTPTPEVK